MLLIRMYRKREIRRSIHWIDLRTRKVGSWLLRLRWCKISRLLLLMRHHDLVLCRSLMLIRVHRRRRLLHLLGVL